MCYSLGKGAFAIPPDTRKEISKRVGDKAYREKIGIHARVPKKEKMLPFKQIWLVGIPLGPTKK